MYTTHDYLSNRIVIHIRNPNDVRFFKSLFPKDNGTVRTGYIIRYDEFKGRSKFIDSRETQLNWYAKNYLRFGVPKGYLKRTTLRTIIPKGGD